MQSKVFFRHNNVVATIPRDVVLSVVEESSLEED